MDHLIRFSKASGAGNDFVVVNNIDGSLKVEQSQLACALCAQHTGIGADGLLVIERSVRADFLMLYYNSDGSHGGMCGNGGRCIVQYAFLAGICGNRTRFEALDHIYDAEILSDGVRLEMKPPVGFRSGLSAEIAGKKYECHAIDTGAPHLVVFTEKVDAVDVQGLGRKIRYHEVAGPAGANVNFVELTGKHAIRIRTYERGVEAETLACGTGSVASAIASSLVGGVAFPVSARVQSGAVLTIRGKRHDDSVSDLQLEGPADILFSGKVLYDETRGELKHHSDLSIL